MGDQLPSSVVQIDPAGAAGSPLALPEFSCPGGLAFDKQGNLWVVSEGTRTTEISSR